MQLSNLLSRFGIGSSNSTQPKAETANRGQAEGKASPPGPVDSATIGRADPLEKTMQDDKKLREMSRRSGSGNLTMNTEGGLGLNVGGGLSVDLSSGNMGVNIGGGFGGF